MRTLPAILVASLLSLAAAIGQTVETVFSFPNDGSQGEYPSGAMAAGPGGLLYGTTIEGGVGDNGTAFKISTGGAFTSLGSFNPATTGKKPYSRLISIGDGFLYGVTERNTGTSGDPNGTLFKLDPVTGPSVVFQVPGFGATPKFPRALVSVTPGSLHVLGADPAGLWQVPLNGDPATPTNFDSNTIGTFAYSITLGSDGRLYGTCKGVSYVGTDPNLRGSLFRVDANGANLTKLHDCLQATGTSPHGAMVQVTDGNFYGTMSAGGSNTYGCVFRLTPDGTYTVIHHFSSLATPLGDLIQASDGFLYGTAQTGGTNNLGGIFRISLNGAFTVLHNFNGNNGTRPTAGLTQAGDGNLYGVVAEGGAGGKGAIFRVKLSLPPANRAPVALDDIGVTTNSAVVINVIANDFDPESGALTVTSVSSPTAGTATVLGDNTVEYTPGVGFMGTDSFTYTVRDPQGLTSEATVTIQAEPVQAVVFSGVFNGLLHLDPDLAGNTDTPRAQIFVVVRDTGKFTGFMLTQRKRVPFRGAFDLNDGTAVAKVNIPGKGKALLFLGFRPDEEGTLLAIAFGREVWSGSGRPAIAATPSTTGKRTVSIEAVANELPDGYGFGVMQIKPNGLVVCAGKHGDGTKLTWGTTLVSAPDGAPLMPVFAEPLPGGVCAGVLDSRTASSFNFAGNLRWIRPSSLRVTQPYSAGFAGTAVAGVSQFTVQPALSTTLIFGGDGAGTASLGGGPLAAPIVAAFTIVGPPPPALRVQPAAPLKLLTINRNTGLITGKMMNGNTTVKFIGVVSQPYNIGLGQFLIGGTSGAFELAP